MTIRAIICLFVILTMAMSAEAHREDYLDETLVFQTIEKGDFEPESWFDVVAPDGGRFDTLRQHMALEYGFTDHFMADARGTLEEGRGEPARFVSGRLESRMRFKEEGDWPVDVAVSAELNTERSLSGEQEQGVEPRLVLSRDFGRLNVTGNVAEELLLGGGSADTNLAVGVRHDTGEVVRVGAELRYGVRSRTGSVFPQIWILAWHAGTVKIGYSLGFDQNPESFGRLVFEFEL